MLKTHEKFHSTNGKRQILIVDDELINRELLNLVLQDDFETLFATDGRSAIEMVRKNKDTLSLIFLDLLMPGMHGLDVIKILKNDQDLKDIPLIVMTADQEAEVTSLQLGASDFIPKPYPKKEVIITRVVRAIELSEDRDIIQSTERDHLTGLYNREYFYRYAEQFDQHHKGMSMDAIVVDVHHFHMINERYGKAYGDEVLRRIGEKVREMVRDAGGIVCRREADTFLVYCPHRDDYEAILENARIGLSGEEGSDNRVRLRMGVYADVDKSIEMERRFDRAKMASDTVRGAFIRPIAIYDSKLHESEIYAEQLLEDFPSALEQKQFKVFYQPKFDVRPEIPVLTSAEALVRWQHPSLGLISPGLFIPLFEENGLIEQLDRYVWRETAAQIKDWKERFGIAVPVSVNVSRIDIYDPELINILKGLLEEFDLKPGELLLEITESAYTQDSTQIIAMVNELRSLGFKIEMDDFGTGYSSLNMISSLPIDALKLDMKFIRNAFNTDRDTRLIEVIIDIADYLSVPIIAEGVETEEQLNALKSMGCDLVQGYYFSKPVPSHEYEVFIEEKIKVDKEADAAKELIRGLTGESALSFGDAHVLSNGFEVIYYVDLTNGHYVEFTAQGKYDDLQIERSGSDFFSDTQDNIPRVIYEEDRERVKYSLSKDVLISHLSSGQSFSMTYRLLIGNVPTYYNLHAVHASLSDEQHIVIGVSNVADQILQTSALDVVTEKGNAFLSIAQTLSSDLESVYYVDIDTDDYIEFVAQGSYEDLQIELSGKRFFDECRKNIQAVVYSEDQPIVERALSKSVILSILKGQKAFTLVYRLLIDGRPTYYQLKAAMTADGRHLVIGVSNVEARVASETSFLGVSSSDANYSRIYQALSQEYLFVFYVDTRTDHYVQYDSRNNTESLALVLEGEKFFDVCSQKLPEMVLEEDLEKAIHTFDKTHLLNVLESGEPFSTTCSILMDGRPVYVNFKFLRLKDDPDHIVMGVSNIDAQMRQQQELEKAKKDNVTFTAIAQALAADYFSIYYVNTDTDEFVEFSANDDYQVLGIKKEGIDFFNLSRANIARVLHPEDRERVLSVFTKENLLREMGSGGSFTLNYRLMFGDVSTSVSMKATHMSDPNDPHIVIGVNNVDAQTRRDEEYEKTKQESVTFSAIAQALAADYFSIYYIDTISDDFVEFSAHDDYEALGIEKSGSDFFNLSRENILRVVHPDDHDKILSAFTKENLLKEMEISGTFTLDYRLMFDGEPTYVSMKATHLADRNDPHIVIGVNNIDAQMKRQLEYDAAKAQNMTYARIAQALSKDYYSIYMVNTENDEYVEYASTSDYQDLHVQQSGKDFFRECRENIMRLVHKEDREMALAVWDKTKLMPELENGKTFSSTYRLMMDGVPVYINCKVIRMEGAEEKKYIVIGVSNVDAQMRRERELNIAREKANRDALTGVKSKHAYDEVILDMNEKIQSGTIEPFAVAVCDVNGLKQINDTKGHQFGDKLIRDASHIICETFKHSPVFRIGGDEFVAIMMHSDYEKREELIRSMAEKNGENKDYGGVIIACGYSDWDPGHDERYEDVFERADASMYVNKESLKN